MTLIGLPNVFDCPRSWKYTNDWWKKYETTHGRDHLSKVCKHSGAGFNIMYTICENGEMALTKTKTQNMYIKRLTTGKVDPRKINESDIDWQSGHTWVAIQERREALFDIYNADLAPADILSILDEVGRFMDEGQAHCQALLLYITNARGALDTKEEAARDMLATLSSTRKQAPDWKLIDERHSAVTDGFIYLLANSLMPEIYKIGFTAGNPDKRAREISMQYGLPLPFEMIQYWRTKDPYITEQRIHLALADYAKAGEFFEVDLQHATETIQSHVTITPPIEGIKN